MPKKLKAGPFGIFKHPSVAKHQTIDGGPLGKDSLVSPGMVFYAEKEEKPFWFSWLGQMMQ